MKIKYKIISNKEALKWYNLSNLFAKSLCPINIAIHQFNQLSSYERSNIKKEFKKYDDIRRIKIPKGESDATWFTSVMVDANIIATDFNIDPITAVMCLTPPCRINERIIVK